MEIVESCEGVRCRSARSSADVCQRDTVRQRMGGGNTPGGVSPHPQGARLALRLVRQGDGLHYPVGQPLFGDSCKARLDRPNDGSRSAGEGLCVLQSFLFTTQQEH